MKIDAAIFIFFVFLIYPILSVRLYDEDQKGEKFPSDVDWRY
ncbi:hypothetical protein Pf1_01078 [Flavobacterium columnare]|nr:hypothetical protein Pf1_01078 [Flavobacterium columnare]